MIRQLTRLGALAAILVAACGSTDEEDRPPVLGDVMDRPIDSLKGDEGKLLCEAVLAHTDPCPGRAQPSSSVESCNEKLASCRAAKPPAPSCQAMDFGPPGTCPVTASEYLTCLDAWNAAQTCEKAGKLIQTPASCQKLVSSCVRFAGDFYQPGQAELCTELPELPPSTDTNDDIYGLDGCRPLPTRLIVLGDGTATCKTTEFSCTPDALADYLNSGATSGLVVESHAVGGSFTADLPAQAAEVEGGPGPVLVYIHSLGDELAAHHVDWDGWHAAWAQVFAYFSDTTRFPDGATFLMNTQYSSYDQCPNPPGLGTGIPLEEEAFIQEVNQKVIIEVAEQRADAVAIDHYPDFIGHGLNANIQGCHCQENNNHWLGDKVHPNSLGYEHMTAKWMVALDAMYGPVCGN